MGMHRAAPEHWPGAAFWAAAIGLAALVILSVGAVLYALHRLHVI